MKQTFKALIVMILGWQVRRLHQKNQFKTIGVVGSIGKTSTKTAIAQVLGISMRVQYQSGNYNDIVSVPLVFFGLGIPSLFNPVAWVMAFIRIEQQLRKPYPFDVVVVELGTDRPGQIAQFAQYLHVDVAVVTALTPEHMEFFKTMDAVATEELSVMTYAKRVIVNVDLCPSKLLPNGGLESYSLEDPSDYRITNIKRQPHGFGFEYVSAKQKFSHRLKAVSEIQLYSVLAACATASILEVHTTEIIKGIDAITAVPGRLQLLNGVHDSLIIDDTYNASPDAVQAALQTLYEHPGAKRIALLGNMNELGADSAREHTAIGEFCNPSQVDLVITLGSDANEYLAAAAERQGCRVVRANNAAEAGELLITEMKPGTILLAKGSQNGVYAEEAVKRVLANKSDADKLVRQSPDWLNKKQRAY